MMENATNDNAFNNGQETFMVTTNIKEIKVNKYTNVCIVKEPLNGADWSRCIIITPLLKVYKVWEYVNGMIKKLDTNLDPITIANWESNNELVSDTQLGHINQNQYTSKV